MRFSKLEGSWKEIKIGEILKIGSGKDYKHLENGIIPVYGTGGYMTSVDDYLYSGETVCIGRKGTIDKPFYYYGKLWTVDTLFYTHSFKNIIPKFLFYVFEQINWLKYNEASGVPSLSKKTIEQIKIIIPEIEEQKRISILLSLIDNRISTQNKILEDYELLKKGMMQKLFKQEFRFKDKKNESFPNWKTTKLDNVVDIVKGKQLNKELLTEKDIYPCQNGGIEPSGFTNMYNTLENTITISEGGNSCGYVNYMQTKFWCGGHCYSLLNIKNNVVNKFLYQYLKFYQTKIMSLRVGSGLPNIQKKDIVNLKISIPCHEEQQKIANILSAIDAKITLETKLLEQYKSQKKYLLQNLFI
ncbi:restriction endonuclease subunit S [Wenyingzhuangia sp. IMCC45467]